MGNRTLAMVTDKDDDTVIIERLSSGRPGIMVTIINFYGERNTVVVEDGFELIRPVINWLEGITDR